jgi:uncharacterized protein
MDSRSTTGVARGWRERLIGLAWARKPRLDALLIPRCRSVHTFGMRFPLDLYWLGPDGAIVRVDREVARRRIARCAQARAVIEVPSRVSRPGA